LRVVTPFPSSSDTRHLSPILTINPLIYLLNDNFDMRYTSAVVLSTLAVGQATAAHLHNRHASFHERRQAEAKRDLSDVDWSKVAYDLTGVDWSTVKYNLPGQSTPAPAPANPAPQPSAPAQPSATPSAAPQAAHVDSTLNNLVTDITQGVAAVASRLGALAGQNSKTNNGQIWIGNDSPWKVTYTNQASDDAVLYCWSKASGYSGPFIAATQPLIGAGIKAGQSLTLSYAGNVGTACAPVFPNTNLLTGVGYIYNTWFEVTFPGGGGTGGFDVTRLPNMNGRSIVAQGSQCKSDLNTCVFKCTTDADHCTTGYDLFGCGAGTGGGGGYDSAMGGTGGGCNMGQGSETINVSLY